MKYDYLNIIGLMSGTSMDGIDISLVKSNGLDLIRVNKNYFYKYTDRTKDFLSSILNKDLKFNLKRKNYLDDLVTEEHYKALKDLDIISKSDLIGFHGQTIYHNPVKKCSIQLGNPHKLAKLLNKKVIFNFREKDILLGGQGAPLAPIYHKFIIESHNFKLPACILNIGGITNLTYWDGQNLIGFDTGPGNYLMDKLIKNKTKKYFDEGGVLASKGIPDKISVRNFIDHPFFKQLPPKSLDSHSFIDIYEQLINKKFSISNTLATLAEFTVESVVKAQEFLPKEIKSVLVTGGGYKNNYIMELLKNRLNGEFFNQNQLDIDFDYVEAELIAFLSARSIYNLPLTFPSTTGVLKASSGGKIYDYL